MVKEAKQEFSALIDQIADIARKRHKISKEKGELLNRTGLIHATFFLAINKAINEKGKPLYGNERARDAAVMLKIAEDKEHQQLRERLRELNDEDEELLIQ